jgi:hypothetical protein
MWRDAATRATLWGAVLTPDAARRCSSRKNRSVYREVPAVGGAVRIRRAAEALWEFAGLPIPHWSVRLMAGWSRLTGVLCRIQLSSGGGTQA